MSEFSEFGPGGDWGVDWGKEFVSPERNLGVPTVQSAGNYTVNDLQALIKDLVKVEIVVKGLNNAIIGTIQAVALNPEGGTIDFLPEGLNQAATYPISSISVLERLSDVRPVPIDNLGSRLDSLLVPCNDQEVRDIQPFDDQFEAPKNSNWGAEGLLPKS